VWIHLVHADVWAISGIPGLVSGNETDNHLVCDLSLNLGESTNNDCKSPTRIHYRIHGPEFPQHGPESIRRVLLRASLDSRPLFPGGSS